MVCDQMMDSRLECLYKTLVCLFLFSFLQVCGLDRPQFCRNPCLYGMIIVFLQSKEDDWRRVHHHHHMNSQSTPGQRALLLFSITIPRWPEALVSVLFQVYLVTTITQRYSGDKYFAGLSKQPPPSKHSKIKILNLWLIVFRKKGRFSIRLYYFLFIWILI